MSCPCLNNRDDQQSIAEQVLVGCVGGGIGRKIEGHGPRGRDALFVIAAHGTGDVGAQALAQGQKVTGGLQHIGATAPDFVVAPGFGEEKEHVARTVTDGFPRRRRGHAIPDAEAVQAADGREDPEFEPAEKKLEEGRVAPVAFVEAVDAGFPPADAAGRGVAAGGDLVAKVLPGRPDIARPQDDRGLLPPAQLGRVSRTASVIPSSCSPCA